MLPSRSLLTVIICEHIANSQNKHRRWWQRKAVPMDFVPAVREVLGVALYHPEARRELLQAIRETDQEEQ